MMAFEPVVGLGLIASAALAMGRLADELDRRLARRGPQGGPVGPAVPEPPATIVAAYYAALAEGWPPGELATFIEVGRRAGTSGERVRSVIDRHWAL